MMISLGPIIFGLILGLLVGSQIKLNVSDAKFTLGSFVFIVIAAIIVAWQSGNFPFTTFHCIFICFNWNFCRQTNICKE